MIVRKEADLAATELTMTATRQKFVEFTTPVITTKYVCELSLKIKKQRNTQVCFSPDFCRYRTYIKRPEFTAIKWTAYSDPFYPGIWLSIGIIMMLSSYFIYYTSKHAPVDKYGNNNQRSVRFKDILFGVYAANCGHGTMK